MSLEILIHPHHPDYFFQEFWERNVFHVKRNDSAYFSFLSEDISIQEIIWQTCQNWGDVSLARSKTDYESAPYAAMPVNLSSIKKAFEDDYTIIINNLERRSVCIAKFCREVEKSWYFNSNINLYYTKPNSQGLDYHYDTDDVFILQLEGKKYWRIYEKRSDLPLNDSTYENLDCDSSPFKEYELLPGDVLYIPRGVVHEARAGTVASVHLTLSVSVIRWVSLLQQFISVIAQNDVEFRKAVPIDLLRDNKTDSAQSTIRYLLSKLDNKNHLSATISEMQDRLLVAKQRLPMEANIGVFADKILLESKVCISKDQLFIITKTSAGLCLKFIGASVEVSDDLEQAVRFICKRDPFVVNELPGELTPNEKLALVGRLIDCEFLSFYSAG